MSSVSELDIINNAVCRTCLQTGHLTSLDDAYCAAMCLGEMLTLCTRVKMPVANDGLPTHICQDCLCELNQAHKFALKCQKSDDKLRNHLNKNINTSAVVQISRRNYGITHTNGICIKTEEAANINSPNVINTIQNTNDLNANVKLEADLTLGISDLSVKQENVKTLEDTFKSPSLNDSFECIDDFKISLREPLPTSVIQTDLDQQLDVIKHEIDCDVKTEMQQYISYRNEECDVNRASVNLHENATEPKSCRQSSKLLPEKETRNKIISVHTKTKNALSSCVNSIEFKKSHNMISVDTDETTTNQPENAMNMKNAVIILEDINVHLKSLRNPIQHQFEQLNSAVSKSINKIAIIADTSITCHQIGQIRRDRQTSKINDQYCTKMPVKPYRVKRKSKCRAIDTIEEIAKSATSRLRHQVHIRQTCKCTVCENNKRELKGHTMKHTRETLCPPDSIVKSITRKEGGTRHVLKHMGKKSFVCKISEKTDFSQRLLTHAGGKPYPCGTCDKTFTQKGSLTAHKLTHTVEKPYSCATCDKTFTRKEVLTKHIMTHTGEKPYSCATCGKTFTQRGSLTAHKLTHSGEKPYSCATCDKTFTQKGSLTTHKLTHTGEKPYSCATCGKTFTQRGSLTAHKLTHTGEKPYSCATCDKTFTRKEVLTRHMLTHTGEKPYSSATCDKIFNHRGNLTKHRKDIDQRKCVNSKKIKILKTV